MTGHYVRHRGRMGQLADQTPLYKTRHGGRDHVDHRQVQSGGHAGRAIRRHAVHEDDVESAAVASAFSLLQNPGHAVVSEYDVAEVSAPPRADRQGRKNRSEVIDQVRDVHAHPQGKPVGRVYFRIVLPVAFRERREHGDAMTGVGQRSHHPANKVPMAFAGERLHGQYVRPLSGWRPDVAQDVRKSERRDRPHRRRSWTDDQRPRHRRVLHRNNFLKNDTDFYTNQMIPLLINVL